MADPPLLAYAAGTPQQHTAEALLARLALFTVLAPYAPALTGPVAVGLTTAPLRLVVHCSAPDFAPVVAVLRAHYGTSPGFALWRRRMQGQRALLCRIVAEDARIDVVVQPQPTSVQNAVRATHATAALLRHAGPDALPALHALQREGLSAEDALAEYFTLPGTPRRALLALADSAPAIIDTVVGRAATRRQHCRYCRSVAAVQAPGRAYANASAVLVLDPRAAAYQRVLLLPRRHAGFLEFIPERILGTDGRMRLTRSPLQDAPLQAEALDPPYDRQVRRIWWKLGDIVAKAFPGRTTKPRGWTKSLAALAETATPQEQDAHAYGAQLVFPEGVHPVGFWADWPPLRTLEMFDRGGPELPVEEQRAAAARLRRALAATPLPTPAEMVALGLAPRPRTSQNSS
jgi:hypothetical protein